MYINEGIYQFTDESAATFGHNCSDMLSKPVIAGDCSFDLGALGAPNGMTPAHFCPLSCKPGPVVAPHEDFTFDPFFRRVTLNQVLAGKILAGMELAEVSARVSTELAAMTATTPTLSIVSSFSVPLSQFPSISTYYTYLQTVQRRTYLQYVCDVADGAVDAERRSNVWRSVEAVV